MRRPPDCVGARGDGLGRDGGGKRSGLRTTTNTGSEWGVENEDEAGVGVVRRCRSPRRQPRDNLGLGPMRPGARAVVEACCHGICGLPHLNRHDLRERPWSGAGWRRGQWWWGASGGRLAWRLAGQVGGTIGGPLHDGVDRRTAAGWPPLTAEADVRAYLSTPRAQAAHPRYGAPLPDQLAAFPLRPACVWTRAPLVRLKDLFPPGVEGLGMGSLFIILLFVQAVSATPRSRDDKGRLGKCGGGHAPSSAEVNTVAAVLRTRRAYIYIYIYIDI